MRNILLWWIVGQIDLHVVEDNVRISLHMCNVSVDSVGTFVWLYLRGLSNNQEMSMMIIKKVFFCIEWWPMIMIRYPHRPRTYSSRNPNVEVEDEDVLELVFETIFIGFVTLLLWNPKAVYDEKDWKCGDADPVSKFCRRYRPTSSRCRLPRCWCQSFRAAVETRRFPRERQPRLAMKTLLGKLWISGVWGCWSVVHSSWVWCFNSSLVSNSQVM